MDVCHLLLDERPCHTLPRKPRYHHYDQVERDETEDPRRFQTLPRGRVVEMVDLPMRTFQREMPIRETVKGMAARFEARRQGQGEVRSVEQVVFFFLTQEFKGCSTNMFDRFPIICVV